MAGQRIHIVPHEQGWALKREGQNTVESVHPTQKDALDAGRDLSRQDEVDIVVHRADGTFRNVLTYTNEPMSNNGNGNGKKIEAHDVMSVGSRASWSAILIGACVALAIYAVLLTGGLALGLSIYDNVNTRTLSVAGAIWTFVSTLFAVFCGGYVVSRLTAGEDRTEAAMYGVGLWGVLLVLSLALASSGASTAAQFALARPVTVRPTYSTENYRAAGLSNEQIDKLSAMDEQEREMYTQAAWWGFAGMVISMGAAVLGAIVGSGPVFTLRFLSNRQPTTVQAQPS